jgi:hypothetical protein
MQNPKQQKRKPAKLATDRKKAIEQPPKDKQFRPDKPDKAGDSYKTKAF